jgi:hypothetical protein
MVFLVEGSTYMDTWTSAMLWAYLWATHWADEYDKPCAAYAVDAGEIKSGSIVACCAARPARRI